VVEATESSDIVFLVTMYRFSYLLTDWRWSVTA